MSARRAKAPAVPPMHPRERLTRKARAAISKYAIVKSRGLPLYHELMVAVVLQAERMPRARLYEWLEEHGFQWRPGRGWCGPVPDAPRGAPIAVGEEDFEADESEAQP